MDQKMAELKAMQSTLQDLLKQRSAAEEAQLQSLVKIYENMKPKAAAASSKSSIWISSWKSCRG